MQELQRVVSPDLPHSLGKEELFFTKGRAQVLQPGGVRVVLSKERATHPLGIAGLKKAYCKHLLARHLTHAVYHHLAGSVAHGRATRRAGQAGHARIGIAENLPASREWHLEVVARSRVALHEHVVGYCAESNLLAPSSQESH